VSSPNDENLAKESFRQQSDAEEKHEKSRETLNLGRLVKENYRILYLINILYVFQFRFATFIDLFYLILATIASLTLGLTIPFSMLIFGNAIDSFTDRALNLCSLNFTSFAGLYCPPGTIVTPTNFYTSIS
jgi:hypothetical protein